MRVLFVEFSFDKWFNASVAALSSWLKEHGHSVQMHRIDYSTTDEDFKRLMVDSNPELIAFSCMTFQWAAVEKFSVYCKIALPEVPIIAGGYHPTFYPDQVVGHDPIDIVCLGEGEYAMLELIEAMEAGEDITGIKNLWVKDRATGKVSKNEIRPLVDNLDEFPYWDRDIFDFDNLLENTARATIFHEKYNMPIAAGKGCPYVCTYCSNTALLKMYKGLGKFTRVRSVDHVLGEMKVVRERYPIKKFEFWDEIFGVNMPWLREFAPRYAKEVGLPFTVFLRPEQSKPKVLNLLKEAGCSMVLMGVEHGDEGFREKALHRKMSNDYIVESFHNARDAGIETTALNMIALPNETVDLARKTLELNRRIEPDVVCVFIYQAFPGTELFDECVEAGYIPERDQTKVAWYEDPEMHLDQPSISHEQVMEVYREFQVFQGEMESKRSQRGQALA